MAPRRAIFYAENPLAVMRDFQTERDQRATLRAIERALFTVAEDDPLASEAFRRRQAARHRNVVGAGEAAARILASRKSAVLADLPAAPSPPR